MRREEIYTELRALQASIDALTRLLFVEEEEGKKLVTVPALASESEYLTAREVCAALNIGSTTLYRWIREGRFPEGRRLGAKARRWKRSELGV